MQQLKHRTDRLLALARRARQFAEGDSGLVADLYEQHAAICEGKAAAEILSRGKSKREMKTRDD